MERTIIEDPAPLNPYRDFPYRLEALPLADLQAVGALIPFTASPPPARPADPLHHEP